MVRKKRVMGGGGGNYLQNPIDARTGLLYYTRHSKKGIRPAYGMVVELEI